MTVLHANTVVNPTTAEELMAIKAVLESDKLKLESEVLELKRELVEKKLKYWWLPTSDNLLLAIAALLLLNLVVV